MTYAVHVHAAIDSTVAPIENQIELNIMPKKDVSANSKLLNAVMKFPQ